MKNQQNNMTNMNIRIIGITGRKFAGKDTTGNLFVEKYGFERLAYADPLKDAMREIFGFNHEQLYGNLKETNDPYWNVTPRKTLQFVGTDLFRNHICEFLPDMGRDIWVHVLRRKMMNRIAVNPDAKFVITDVRFPNELAAIKSWGGITIKIERESDAKDMHESEALIDSLQTDYVFQNNGTKEELYDEVTKKLNLQQSVPVNITLLNRFLARNPGENNNDNKRSTIGQLIDDYLPVITGIVGGSLILGGLLLRS